MSAISTVLVANRAEIAGRVIRTARRLGVRTVAVYSDADADLPYVAAADDAVPLGAAAPSESYLSVPKLLDAARATGADAVHPGYGFLAENPEFAQAVTDAGLIWIGPDARSIAAMGDKVSARNRMAEAGVPILAGTVEPPRDADDAATQATRVGYPVMVKPSRGGGGIGMTAVSGETELRRAYETARAGGSRFFGDPAILLERYLPHARHVEVQIVGCPDGRVVALGERDCSVQRRHQKIAEEAPSTALGSELRARMLDAAELAGRAVEYRNAGTVEFLVDPAAQEFVFLEMNTRLQVEHTITEAVTGIDLVEVQLAIAGGTAIEVARCDPQGHAIEFRVCAEDPRSFYPAPGTITDWVAPAGTGIRVDAGYASGSTVTPFYDSLLAKLVVWGADRADALQRSRGAVAGFRITGVKTNLPFFADLLEDPAFVRGDYDTDVVAGVAR